jgi:predicted nucleotidyltransferase
MVQTHSASPAIQALARRVALRYAELPQVEAVALGGSRVSGSADASSDIDLYVYYREPVALEVRRQIAAPATRAEIGNEVWEPGDEWIDAETGVSVDVMFRHVEWIKERLDGVLNQHWASAGYSTCFWYNVLHSQILFDRQGWFLALQKDAERPYSRELKCAVIAKNFPILRRNMSSYVHQIELAIAREDPIGVNHRVTALLASYFDILFAVNEQPHPGEKRLVQFATRLCPRLPGNFPRAVDELLALLPGRDRQIIGKTNELLDGLESLLRGERLLSEAGELLLVERGEQKITTEDTAGHRGP